MKYLIQSILVAVTLLTVSCNDYLDRFPKDSFSEPTFFKTENDLIYYANQFYGSYPYSEWIMTTIPIIWSLRISTHSLPERILFPGAEGVGLQATGLTSVVVITF